jgi:hypothetical protein
MGGKKEKTRRETQAALFLPGLSLSLVVLGRPTHQWVNSLFRISVE